MTGPGAWIAAEVWDAAVRHDLPPNVVLIDGVAADGRVAVGADLDTVVWAMTPGTWDALTVDQRAEFFA